MNFEALVKHISTIQNTLQAQAAHAVNLALTSRNWLMGCYIVEFEQNGEDRAAYGEQLLKKLEQRLKTKGLNERRFREFRRLYLVYPQLKEPITQYIASQIQIRQSLTAEFTEPMRVCQNALIYRFTPVTDSCNRGKFLKKGVLTQPHLKMAFGNYQQNTHKPKHG